MANGLDKAGLCARESGLDVFLMDAPAMNSLRAARNQNPRFASALKQLQEDAGGFMNQGPFSVTFKNVAAPGGDPHNYLSQGGYWWPDPEKPDGLPYVRRDGEKNPEYTDERMSDFPGLSRMIEAVTLSSLEYYLTGCEPYALQAWDLLRVWFISPQTRMNPNLEYAQGIPGRCAGRSTGIIDAREMVYLVDAIGLIGSRMNQAGGEKEEIKKWFDEFLHWLKNSPKGREAQRAPNNIGTWYDVLVISSSFFTGRDEIARRQIEAHSLKRIAGQIAPDGSQPNETARTRSWHYSVHNLRGLFFIARLAEHAGFDLWNYTAENGSSIRKAFDYLLPYAAGEKRWRYKQITEMCPGNFGSEILPLAARAYDDPRCRRAYEILEPLIEKHFGRLVFPGAILEGKI